MSARTGRSQMIRHKYTKIYLLTAALCVVTALIVAIVSSQAGSVKPRPAQTSGADPATGAPDTGDPVSLSSDEQGQTSGGTIPSGSITYVECTASQLTAVSPLRIVDAEHPFLPAEAADLTVIKTTAAPADGTSPAVFTYVNQMNAEALTQLQKLQKAMIDQFGEGAKLFVNISYTAALEDKQGGLNIGLSGAKCSDKDCTDVSHSDHSTGYAVDVRYNDGKYLSDPIKSEITAYLQEHCAEYGWVQLWVQNGALTPGKTAGDYWHLRYVGQVHAQYMVQNHLTLAGYMDALRATNYNNRLTILSGGKQYEAYFCAAGAGDVTRVPVPEGSTYTITGNGADGYVVLIEKTA